MYLITDEQREYLSTLDLKKRQKEILKEEYRNGIWYANDIRNVTGGSVPNADIWCFGSPCQSFSLAGKRAGLEGESGLIREVFRILGEIEESSRPEWIIYENVKGMFSSNRGFDFLAILLEMDSLGYDVEWELFNSKWYVPQNRERVYTVGHLRRYGPTKIFPIFPTNEKDNIPEREQNEEKEGSEISLIGHREGFHRNLQTYSSDGITETLDTSGGGGREFNVAVPVETDNVAILVKTDKVTEIYNEYNQSTSTEYVGSLGTDQQSPRKPGGFRVIESVDKDAICPASFIDMDTQAELTDTARCLMARYDKGVNYKLRETSGVCYPLSVSDEIDIKKKKLNITTSPITVQKQSGTYIIGNIDPIFRTISARDSKGFCQQEMSGIALCFEDIEIGV